MAPEAPQRASFKEGGGANAGAIVERKALNIKDGSCGFDGLSFVDLTECSRRLAGWIVDL